MVGNSLRPQGLVQISLHQPLVFSLHFSIYTPMNNATASTPFLKLIFSSRSLNKQELACQNLSCMIIISSHSSTDNGLLYRIFKFIIINTKLPYIWRIQLNLRHRSLVLHFCIILMDEFIQEILFKHFIKKEKKLLFFHCFLYFL